MTKKKDSKPYVGWPLDRLALGERLWGDGYKAGFCAEQCGVTRNAFLGMAHRKRWPRGVAVEPEEKPVKAKAKAKGKPRVAKPELPREIPPAEVGKVRLLDLGFYSCRWPVSGVGMSTLFCGKRSAGSYCEEHQKVSAGVRYGGNDRR